MDLKELETLIKEYLDTLDHRSEYWGNASERDMAECYLFLGFYKWLESRQHAVKGLSVVPPD